MNPQTDQPAAPVAAVPTEATPVASCCSPAAQATCCEPSEKSSCCGTDATASGGCGCR